MSSDAFAGTDGRAKVRQRPSNLICPSRPQPLPCLWAWFLCRLCGPVQRPSRHRCLVWASSRSFHAELKVFYCRFPWRLSGLLDIKTLTAIPGSGVTSSLSANNFLPSAVWLCAKVEGHPVSCRLCLKICNYFLISVLCYQLEAHVSHSRSYWCSQLFYPFENNRGYFTCWV